MLTSSLLRSDTKLQACATGPTFHITRGASGAHVSRLQLALLLLGHDGIERGEWRGATYEPSTAATVLAYKRSRDIVNRSYQQQADDIVGVMTVQRLDAELSAIEALARGAAAPRTRGRMSDSAWSFELRRNVAQLRRYASADTKQSFGDSANTSVPRINPDTIAVANAVVRTLKVVRESAADFAALVQDALASGKHRLLDDLVYPPEGGLRSQIVEHALKQIGPKTFDAMMPGIWAKVHDSNGQQSEKPKPGKIDRQWCGIYAASVITESKAIELGWNLNGGGTSKGGQQFGWKEYSTDLALLAPGDVLVDGTPKRVKVPDAEKKRTNGVIDDPNETALRPLNHHMLILAISVDRRTAYILEGNTGDNTTEKTSKTRMRRYTLPAKGNPNFSYLSVDTMRDRSIIHR